MNIRLLTENDLPVLRQFAENAFRRAWQDSNDPADFEAYCATSFSPEKFLAEMQTPDTQFFFAEEPDSGAVLAYLKISLQSAPPNGAMPAHECLQLERIYLSPDLTGKGMGSQLLGFVRNVARAQQLRFIWLSVWQEAPRSIAFYEKNGLEIFGTSDFWLGNDHQTDWLMRVSAN